MKMTYEEFQKEVQENFKNYLPERYADYQIQIMPVQKINQILDGLSLVPTEKSATISPTIYLNDMYKDYSRNGNLDTVLKRAANKLEQAIREAPSVVPSIDFETAEDNITFQLINTRQNKELLQDVPNRPFHDLSIIYRWVVKTDEEGMHSTVIRNSLAEKIGLSEEQMFNLALKNTRRILPPTVKSMNEVICDMFIKDGMPAEVADTMIDELPSEQTMWVISNERGINGAASMLYEDKLHELAENLKTDLYIMPSSIHEVIAVSTSMGDPNEFAQMVAEINMDQVALEERLSNEVYHYDKDLRKVSLATDTPNKDLDEKKNIYQIQEKDNQKNIETRRQTSLKNTGKSR